jgi:LPS-assembly lipoprotein
MSWLEKARGFKRLAAPGLVLGLGLLTAGCFQPLYGDRSPAFTGGPSIVESMRSVDVQQIDAPNGTPVARLAVEVRNQLLFDLTGGGSASYPTHQLKIALSPTQQQVIVDVTTARPEVQNYGINATYSLTDLNTKKVVISGQTFTRVSYDIPGQQQRFAAARGLRDAENRASKEIADQIRSRLASYFVTGG